MSTTALPCRMALLFRVPYETKAHYSGLGFDLGAPARVTGLDAAHSSDLRDRR